MKLESYRDNLIACKDDFICVPDAFKPGLTEPPAPNFIALREYLKVNDCTKVPDDQKNDCYVKTRLLLIQTNEKLDKAELDNFVLNRSVERLQNSITKIIDDFPKVTKLK